MAKAKASGEQSELLALLRKKSAGCYERVKNTEAKAGGRNLPPGLRDGVARATQLKLDKTKNDDLYAYLYGNCIEPTDCAGLHAGIMYQLYDSQYSTFEECFLNLVSALKLMGYAEWIGKAEESTFFGETLPAIMADIEANKPLYLFGTGKKVKDDGSVNVFVTGSPAADYVPPTTDEASSHADKGYEKKDAPKTPPGKAAPPSPPGKSAPPPVEVNPFPVGCSVKIINDYFKNGTADGEYEGAVTAVDLKSKICTVVFEGTTDNYEIPFGNLHNDAAPSAPPKPSDFVVGQKVVSCNDAFGNGINYSGIVKTVGENIAVTFEDGDTAELPRENLQAV